nr:uncharacterized protein LOC129380865 [Dermacentor andersoni]
MAPVSPEDTPDILQWNCRGLQACASELNLLFERIGYPSILLLQETKGTSPGLHHYKALFSPSITHAHYGQKKIQAQSAILVHKDTPNAQLDTATFCTPHQEIVAAKIRYNNKHIVIASAYYRPSAKPQDTNFDWLWQLKHAYPRDAILVGGDFNAPHETWGYRNSSSIGTRLNTATEKAGLLLASDIDYPTRRGMQPGQRDTIPDLTWHSGNIIKDWRCGHETMGSDHYPIWIELNSTLRKRRRTTQTVNWQKFREALDGRLEELPVEHLLRRAKEQATTTTLVTTDVPTPDTHLLNLWESRKQAEQEYILSKKDYKKLLTLRKRTAEARRYAKQLTREKWLDFCSTLSHRSGTGRLWRTFRAMNGQKKTRNNIENILIRTGQTVDELEHDAAYTFFPQPVHLPPYDIYTPLPSENSDGINAPFSLFELELALSQVKRNSAPGKDGISWSMLRNADTNTKHKLLELINKHWQDGSLPKH